MYIDRMHGYEIKNTEKRKLNGERYQHNKE